MTITPKTPSSSRCRRTLECWRFSRRLSAAVGCAAAASFLGSCANATHTFAVQEVQLGLDGSVNPQNNNVKLKIGYTRQIATVIPKVNLTKPGTNEKKHDAGSVFITSNADFHGLSIPEVDEIIATGKAAENLGRLDESKEVFAKKAVRPQSAR